LTVNVAVPQRSPIDLIHQEVVDVRMFGQYLLKYLLNVYYYMFRSGDEVYSTSRGTERTSMERSVVDAWRRLQAKHIRIVS